MTILATPLRSRRRWARLQAGLLSLSNPGRRPGVCNAATRAFRRFPGYYRPAELRPSRFPVVRRVLLRSESLACASDEGACGVPGNAHQHGIADGQAAV